MASVQSVHMNYDPLSSSASGTKRKLGDVGSPAPLGMPSDPSPGLELGDAPPDADLQQSEARGEMSESKRRAQNRAAQRAFRERKERHLKELEARLAQLESESRSWKSTNMALRSQLSLLEEELQHYRRPPGESGPSNAANNAPNGGLPAHMLPQQSRAPQYHQQQGSIDHGSSTSHTGTGNSPDSMSLPGLSFDSPSSASTTPNRADEFCDKLSLACGTRDRPVPIGAPQIAAESPRWQEDSVVGLVDGADWTRKNGGVWGNMNFVPESGSSRYGSQQLGAQQDFAGGNGGSMPYSTDQNGGSANVADDPLNLDFGFLSSGFGGFGQLGGDSKPVDNKSINSSALSGNGASSFLNNDFAVFDPLEDMLEWNPTKDVTSQPQSQQPDTPQQSQHTPPQSILQTRPQASAIPQQRPMVPRSGAVANTLRPDAAFKVEESEVGLAMYGNLPDVGPLAGLEEQVPAASQRFIPCSDVWDRICNHPRFGEIDINSMCQELRSRARCSNTGVVLDEEDVNKVLGTIK